MFSFTHKTCLKLIPDVFSLSFLSVEEFLSSASHQKLRIKMWPLSDLRSWYSWLFYDIADPRSRDFAFLGSPVPMILFYGSYLILCMKIIPRFMENRKPIRLQQSSWILECVCFLMSLFFVIRGWKIWMKFNWRCEPIDFSRSEEAMEVSLLVKSRTWLRISFSRWSTFAGISWCQRRSTSSNRWFAFYVRTFRICATTFSFIT